MKKEYLKPTIDITTLETETLMAASSPSFNDGDGTGQGSIIEDNAQGPALSTGPKYDVWDFDEEE